MKWDAQGNQIWNLTWNESSNDYTPYKSPIGIEVSPDGSIFVLGARNNAPFIIEWNAQGEIKQAGLIDVEYFMWGTYYGGRMTALGTNGVLYAAGRSGEEGYLTLLGFHVLPTLILSVDRNFTSAAVGAGITSFAIIGLVIWSKKRGLNLPTPYDSGLSDT